MTLLAAAIIGLASFAGIALTLLTLPGLWFIVVTALALQWWIDPPLYSWWTLGAALAIGVVAEIAEIIASGAGARRAGGGRTGAWLAVLGAFVGAIAGSFVVPIVGTIAGAVLGAGAGAVAGERGIDQRPWRDAARVGRGAMTGRFLALILKAFLTAVVGVLLTVAAAVP